ncbi:MAG: chromosome segregation protein SMC [Planctomycetota bacterium]
MDLSELARLGKPLHVRIEALVLDNFKSFPRRTRIPIRDGFTTISGPNGSGKSNLIDALQFVLATSSSKGMRADRLSDLISELGQKPRASVTLELVCTFSDPEGGKGGRVIERKLDLTRAVRRRKSGAEIRYALNGNPIRLCDLHDVLRHVGLPTSGQNFVLQNDVIRLTAMGPVPRRQVLDELAGTKDFDQQIALALRELEDADRLGADTALVLEELGKRLVQLRAERDQALKHQELSERKHSLEEDLTVLEVTEAEVAALRQQAELTAGEEARTKAERALAKRRAEADKARAALQKLEDELSHKGEGERMAAFRAVEGLKARVAALDEQLALLSKEAQRRAEQHPKLEAAAADAERAFKSAQHIAGDVERQLTEQLGLLEALNRRYEAASASLQREHKDRFEKADRMRALRKQAELLRAEEAELIAKERELADRFSRGEERRSLLASGVAQDGGRAEGLKQEAAAASERYRAAREEHAQLEARRRRLIGQVQTLRSGLETLHAKIGRAETGLATIEAKREQALTIGGGRAIEALRDARLSGIHGTVSELIRFEADMAGALEAAAAGRLNLLVVDDEDVVGRAIQVLKRTGAGRLSFAPLSRVRGQSPGATPKGQGVIGFAIDLIQTERRYLDVMREVFGATLVVERFDDTKPFIGRYRMVTLDGDVVNKNAIMTGGSQGNRGGLLAAAAQASRLVKEREAELIELRRQRSAAADALRETERELGGIGDQVDQTRSRLAEAEARSTTLADELKRLESALGPRADQLAVLEKDLTSAREQLDEIAPRLSEVRTELGLVDEALTHLDDPAGAAAWAELERQATQLERERQPMVEAIDRLRGEEADAAKALTSAEIKLDAALETLHKASEERAALSERREGRVAERAEVAAELKQQEAALAELSSELMALTRARDVARVAADAARDAARDAERELGLLVERLAAAATKLGELVARATELRTAAEQREIEVPPPEEAPSDIPRERARIQGILRKVDKELEDLGAVNALAIEQFEAAEARHTQLQDKVEVLEREKTEIRARIVDLEGKKKTAFLEAFARVRDAFAETYYELGRGEGQLILEDPKDPFAGGLQIKVRPRGKKLSRMEVMSGGEKALTALALIFALQEVSPAAMFIFDEVDKDLDGVNTKILADAIRRRCEERQYLVISHHRTMLERSSQTLGVTMRKGFGTVVTGVSVEESEDLEDEVTAMARAAQEELAS